MNVSNKEWCNNKWMKVTLNESNNEWEVANGETN